MDLMSRKGERAKFKIFALLIAFNFSCFRGGETISNAEVFSPASPTSLARATPLKLQLYFVKVFAKLFLKSGRLRTNSKIIFC
ncbi:MAG: hypothetical protein MR471_08550 [Clostridia bacterium]|nr:hypothetical protein [Clostridia bacterium]